MKPFSKRLTGSSRSLKSMRMTSFLRDQRLSDHGHFGSTLSRFAEVPERSAKKLPPMGGLWGLSLISIGLLLTTLLSYGSWNGSCSCWKKADWDSFMVEPPCTTFSPAQYPPSRSYACPRGFNPKDPKTLTGTTLALRALTLMKGCGYLPDSWAT